MRISFDFYGDQQVQRTLARITQRVEDARPAWEKIAGLFKTAMTRQFASRGGYASGGWAPLSAAYGAWKARHYPGKPILVRTGELRKSLVERPFGVEVIEARTMALGSGVPYGKFHQLGDGVPRRRPVELTETSRREWVKVMQRHLMTEGGV